MVLVALSSTTAVSKLGTTGPRTGSLSKVPVVGFCTAMLRLGLTVLLSSAIDFWLDASSLSSDNARYILYKTGDGKADRYQWQLRGAN